MLVSPPPNTCKRCGHRLCAPDETPLATRPHLICVRDGQVWVRCASRVCQAWCPMPARLLDLLRAVVQPESGKDIDNEYGVCID